MTSRNLTAARLLALNWTNKLGSGIFFRFCTLIGAWFEFCFHQDIQAGPERLLKFGWRPPWQTPLARQLMIEDVILRRKYGLILMQRADEMLSALLNAYDGRGFAQDVSRIHHLHCQHLQFNRPIWELFWQQVLSTDTLQRLSISF